MHLPAPETDPKELTSGGSMLIIIPAAGQQDFPGRRMKVAHLEIPQSDLCIALINFSLYVLETAPPGFWQASLPVGNHRRGRLVG